MRKLFLLPLLTFCLAAGVLHAQNKQPNIILILADDLGYGDVGFNGQKLIKTPNLDKLAKEGARFPQFYSGSTVCAPSRSALISGKHTGHTYIRGNKEMKPEGQFPLADSVVTVAEILKNAGYRTAAYGKWGLGPVDSEGDPAHQGFDFFYGYNCQALAHRYYPNHLWDNNRKVILEANQNLLHNKIYAPDLIQEKAVAFLEQQKKDEPFFLFLPYILPHAELLVPEDSLFQYYKGKFPEKAHIGKDYGPGALPGGYASQEYPHAAFAAMVARLDLYVGQVMNKLKEKGIDENTLVIFTSDNGPHREGGADPEFFNSGGGFKGYKRDLYEGGIRVPFAARWPGVIRPGSINHYTGAFWDILPTFAELAGTAIPQGLDGISFVNALSGKKKQKTHDFLYWEFHEQGGKQAVRQGKWKAILLNAISNPGGPVKLYDLSKDPAETNNIADRYPDKARELLRLMHQSHTPSAVFPFRN